MAPPNRRRRSSIPPTAPDTLRALVDDSVWSHLRNEYTGVLDGGRLSDHVRAYLDPLEQRVHFEMLHRQAPAKPAKVLDVGAGYGAFVRLCRREGDVAFGVDTAPVEVAYANERTRGDDGTEGAIQLAAAERLPYRDASFDVVTMWHVLEHLPERRAAIVEAARVLRSGGTLVVLAPNYATFRSEPHYHLPWAPFLRGRAGEWWLRLCGRDPSFWRDSVHPCSAAQVRSDLRAAGFAAVVDLTSLKFGDPTLLRRRRLQQVASLLDRARVLPVAARSVRLLSRLGVLPSIQLAAVRT